MGVSKRLQRRREKLFARNPYCHWCGVKLVRVTGPKIKYFPPNAATIDHLRSRLDPSRDGNGWGEIRTVLACRECNYKRGADEEKSLPIEVLRARSQRHPNNRERMETQNGAS